MKSRRPTHRYVTLFVVVFALMLISALSGCSRRHTDFRVGFNTWVGYGPFYIAEELGYFREAGLDVRLERIEGTGERRAALIAGRLDAMGSTVDDLLVSVDQGVDAFCVLLIDESAGADGIVAASEIQSVRELKGRRIAVQPGFVNHFFLLFVLDKNGIRPDEVTIVPMEPDKAGAAFINGDVDVAVTWEPYLSAAQGREGAGVLIDTRMEPHIIVDILAVSRRTAESRAADVRAFVRAWFRAIDFYAANPDAGVDIIARAMSLEVAEAQDMLSGVHFVTRTENVDMMQSGSLLRVLKKADQLWRSAGFTEKPVDVAALIDPTFLPSD